MNAMPAKLYRSASSTLVRVIASNQTMGLRVRKSSKSNRVKSPIRAPFHLHDSSTHQLHQLLLHQHSRSSRALLLFLTNKTWCLCSIRSLTHTHWNILLFLPHTKPLRSCSSLPPSPTCSTQLPSSWPRPSTNANSASAAAEALATTSKTASARRSH